MILSLISHKGEGGQVMKPALISGAMADAED
jgi:hypothetical protein